MKTPAPGRYSATNVAHEEYRTLPTPQEQIDEQTDDMDAFRKMLEEQESRLGVETQFALEGKAYVEQAQPGLIDLLSAMDGRKRKFDFDARCRYIEAILRTGSKQQGALAAGVHWSTIQDTRSREESFDEAVTQALEIRKERAEAELYRRGVEGVIEPKFGKRPDGSTGVVGYVRQYSDNLLLAEVRAKNPVYRDKDQSSSGGDGGGVLVIELMPEGPKREEDWEAAWEGITIEGEYAIKEKEDEENTDDTE